MKKRRTTVSKTVRFVLLSAALGLLMSQAALAGGILGLDLGVHGGATGAQDSSSNNFIGGVQARLHLISFLGLELRGSAFQSSYEGPLSQSADLTTYPIQGSVMLYPIPLPKLSIYVLGGGGYHSYDFEYRSSGSSLVSVTGGQWAAHAGAGIDIRLSKAFFLNLDGRYVFLDVSELSQITGKDFDYWSATVGLNWRLF